ncbi:hypothetical protein Z951_27535 [Streptomyces sp. PRh5]|uniref:hypothetical protein n=1 Tax=Streptomyces sp. PRh5 TaxID=1158056 RepID=UPI000451B269|nr:hypothetical protein [Streptomyces sp. PRh5]EXU65037.1 hypothetical protein Z951_27535 [Streptomyces sp. PRh5]
MTAQNKLRLLPWTGPEGKPCYLDTDDREGFMSRLADHIEAEQLGMASELLREAVPVLDDETADLEKLRFVAEQLAGALLDVLRVATSRGSRLSTTDYREGELPIDR